MNRKKIFIVFVFCFIIAINLFTNLSVQAATGWNSENGSFYYYKSDNTKATGWVNINNNWYYFLTDGSMAKGWINPDEKWYYLNDDGVMAINTTIDGWTIDKNGIATQNREISNNGVKFIANYEGFSPTPYRGQDSQNETIGYGHVIQPGESFTSLTESEARDLLKNDLLNFVNGVNSLTNQVDLNSNQFDALVSFSYNCGVHTLAESQLLKDINADASPETLKDDFTKYIHTIDENGERIESLGLWRRRMDEWEVYVNGDYTRHYPNR